MNNEKNLEPRYRVELSEKQLRAITHACEVVARLGLGQLDMALEYCMDEYGNRALTWDDIKEIETIVKPKLGLEMNSSYGVGRFKKVDELFDIRDTFRYRMAWDSAIRMGQAEHDDDRKNLMATFSVCYDTPMNWSGEQLPTINKLETEN